MSERNGEFIRFWKKVGIVSAAMVAVITLSTMLYNIAVGPYKRLENKIEAEAGVRQTVDSLTFVRFNSVNHNLLIIGEALMEYDTRRQRRILRRLEK